MLRYKVQSALALLPLLLLALMIGSATRIDLPLTPSFLAHAIALGLEKLYGILELSGYIIAYLTPLTRGTRTKLILATTAVTLIVAGAVVEAEVIIGNNSRQPSG